MKDAFLREINYARISVTDLCNLRCRYCMPEEGVCKKQHAGILSIENLQTIVDSLTELGVEKVRITGGEPLVRRGVQDLIRHIGQNERITTRAITTNGTYLKENLSVLKDARFESVTVSLDTLSPKKYKFITRFGELSNSLDGLRAACEAGFAKVKINAVLMRGINDDEIPDFIKLGEHYGAEIRFIELMPFQNQQDFAKEHYISADEILARTKGLSYLGPIGNSTAEYYKSENGGTVGFIRPMSQKFCGRCNRIRITADGKLLSCLHSNVEYDLLPHLHNGLTDFIKKAILEKPPAHGMENDILQARNMKDIGG